MTNPQKSAVVLMSGGMDSTLCAAIALSQGYEVAGLHLNYQQRTETREERAFNEICDFYKITKRLVVDVSYFNQIGGSSLTDLDMQVSNANLDSKEIPTSYVPFRNANILAISTSWAEVIGASAIFIGAMQLDSSGYPDCRQNFFDAFQKAIDLGTRPETKIEIMTPLMNLTKADIVREGVKLGVPFHLTWSCYQSSDAPCGVCDSCALRKRGFETAGVKDSFNDK
ncbi:MAG TPA: 7-cyano-7-deazaguanine synthase QueC [Candidatus Kapabacteria bacterium]|nr:7-cyano-7-deazaguanine synthase QueC [Candidatus Kapabacteria bacterium]HPO62661.1 7-cyano-7-deazaguanine synthase QueC [Candidatus Kapabacteria bacterium]